MDPLLNNNLTKNESMFPSLSMKERLIGWAAMTVIGYFLTIMSIIMLLTGTGSTVKFAVLYSIGNACSLFSTSFLIGFKQQLKNMFHAYRFQVSTVLLGCLVSILILALVMPPIGLKNLLILVLEVVEMGAYFWYCLSYLPLGRTIAKKIGGKCSEKIQEDVLGA